MPPHARCALASTLVWLAVGCAAGEGGIALREWTVREGDDPAVPVTLPAHLVGDAFARDGTHVLETDVVIPPEMREHDLELVVPSLAALVTLRADDVSFGRGEHAASYRAIAPQRWRIPRALVRDGSLHLALHVTRRWTQASWIDVVPRLRTMSGTDWPASIVDATNRAGAACGAAATLQVGLTCLLVYFHDRRRRPYLWFGIQAFSASTYPAFVLGALQWLGPIDVVVMELGLLAAVWASVHFTHAAFSLGRPPRAFGVGVAVSAIVVVLFSGPYVATQVAVPFVVALVATVTIYQLARGIGLLVCSRDRGSALLLFLAWMALATTTWSDLWTWYALGEPLGGARPGVVGLAFFALFLSLLLSRNHVLALGDADRLNAELADRLALLEARQKEVEALNAELRHQVASRSEQLFSALSVVAKVRPAVVEPAAGDVLSDRYRLERILDEGGMGVVYEATRVSDGSQFAIKIALEANGTAVARLAREAHLASRVRHPNVVEIVDVDVTRAGQLFLVLELAREGTLKQHRERYRTPALAIVVLAQIAEGLAELHRLGIIHRDLKPANVLFFRHGESPIAKLTDFGISRPALRRTQSHSERIRSSPLPPRASDIVELKERVASEARLEETLDEPSAPDALTELGAVAGTPRYMAPELGRDASSFGTRSDVFGFGVMAYELLSGAGPWTEPPASLVARGVEPLPHIALAARVPSLDPRLLALVDACLSLEPSSRPSAAAIGAELRAIERSLRTSAAPRAQRR
ncbi:serine/threonine-protein kinase [Sandaracinus amylolyticus]|uniref:serine/threonine-protein kinase n=1 Tax=Sandaracinus amylolyticus TaxID=927083 RepID=UPI001F354132|nr:serine/threonine-protein kinase [Sandaracinus amylolyticus]UJR84345.1 Hypothetical protein I5071_64240 [Sandaracinus amylolyticus]